MIIRKLMFVSQVCQFDFSFIYRDTDDVNLFSNIKPQTSILSYINCTKQNFNDKETP